MTNFFTLNLRYERYELGIYLLEYETVYGAKRLRFGGTAIKTFLIIAVITAVLKFDGLKGARNVFDPVLADQIILVIVVGATLLAGGAEIENLFHTLKANKRYKQLTQNGVIINGQLTHIQVQEDKMYINERLPPFKLKEYRDTYYLRAVYQFTTPDGRTISGEQTRARNDLRDKPLPTTGTPIRVLYADDNTHAML